MHTQELTVHEAEETPLMGRPESWDGNGGRLLGLVPDKILKAARRWFVGKLREDGVQPAMKSQMRHQMECIRVVLAQREANSPQGKLF